MPVNTKPVPCCWLQHNKACPPVSSRCSPCVCQRKGGKEEKARKEADMGLMPTLKDGWADGKCPVNSWIADQEVGAISQAQPPVVEWVGQRLLKRISGNTFWLQRLIDWVEFQWPGKVGMLQVQSQNILDYLYHPAKPLTSFLYMWPSISVTIRKSLWNIETDSQLLSVKRLRMLSASWAYS